MLGARPSRRAALRAGGVRHRPRRRSDPAGLAWHSCFNTIVLSGALPVFAEIDESFNLDPGDFEAKVTPQTKLVMAVHLQGCPADLDRIIPIARKHGVKVLEDCAQSVGASYKGRPLGSLGDMGIYSLQLNKTITAGFGRSCPAGSPFFR